MKKLLVTSVLLLTGCFWSKPKTKETAKVPGLIKVGGCFEIKIKQDLERWEENESRISKVLEVGIKKYRTVYTYSRYMESDAIPFYRGEDTFTYVQEVGKEIQCPIQFSGVY